MRQHLTPPLRAALATALGLAAITTAGLGAGPAAAVPAATPARPAISPADLAAMAAQTPLVDAASVIRTAVRSAKPRGYAGLTLTGDHVSLYWKGALPADITRVVSDARRIAPISVEAARFSQTELKTAGATVDKVVHAGRGAAVHGIRARNDGSGLEVVAEPGAAVPALPKTGVPISTVRETAPTPAATREDDQSPWSSGMIMWGTAGGGCTAGFGVRSVSAGGRFLLAAEHCGPVGTTWNDAAGDYIGPTVVTNHDHDIALIAGGPVSGKVYTGGPTDGVQSPVAGYTGVFPGQLLCQSGYTSANTIGGPVCGLEVVNISDDWQNFVSARRPDGQPGARSGDSGGPVYQVTGNGSVLAAGVTDWTGGDGLMGFQDFDTIRADFGNIVPVTATTTGACRVSYQITDQWPGGYTANVTVYNTSAAITDWNLRWTAAAGSTVTSPWRARITQTGTQVSAVGESYIKDIPAAGAVSFGFNGTGTATVPSSFTLNGTTCAS